jgi:hypothetical protein
MDVIGGNHATLFNVTPGPNRFGIPNTAYEFKDDTVNWNFISFPNTLLNGKKTFAISAWLKWTGGSGSDSTNFIHATNTGGNELHL